MLGAAVVVLFCGRVVVTSGTEVVLSVTVTVTVVAGTVVVVSSSHGSSVVLSSEDCDSDELELLPPLLP